MTTVPADRERAAAVQRVLVITLGLNLLASAVKLTAGVTSGSLALIAGGIDSAFDGLANVTGWIAMRVAARPPDAEHPYGHRKFETLVAVGIAVLLLVTCGRLAWDAAVRLASMAPGFVAWPWATVPEAPPAPSITLAVLAAPLASFVLNAAASAYEGRRGRELGSELLVADAGHTRADAGVSLALIGGLLAIRAGWPLVDPLLALAIAGVIAHVGWSIVSETADVLADAAVFDPDDVAEAVRRVNGVVGVHKIRSRGAPDAAAVDLHVQVDPHLGIGRAHEIGHDVQDAIRSRFPSARDVVVHVEPEWALAGGGVSQDVRRVLGRFDVEGHDVHVHADDTGHTEVGLHLEMDAGLSLRDAHARADAIEAAVVEEVPEVDRVVSHLEPRPGESRAVRADDERDWSALLEREAARVDGLDDVHDVEAVRVARGIRLSAHLLADADRSLADVHALAERLEARLRATAPELERVTIHVEPR